LDFDSTTNRKLLLRFQNVPDFPQIWKVWPKISDLGSPKDHKSTLKFKASSNDLAKTVFVQKTDSCFEIESLNQNFRLKGVLEKKEQYIEQLKTQEAELAKRCKHLESLLGR